MTKNKLISGADFARVVGVDSHRVYRAIKNGFFSKAAAIVNPKTRKVELDPVLAADEWALNYNVVEGENKARDQNSGKKPKNEPPALPDTDPNSMAELKRKQAQIRLRSDALELRKLEGGLVDKTKVHAALFEMGKEIRLGLLSIPDRYIDDILAADNRGAGHAILLRAIHEQLNILADTIERELIPDAS